MSVGERITSSRRNMNISQNQLAQALGISRQAVSKWENDQASPDTLNLIKLADLLNTDLEYLATGALSPSPAVQIIEKQVEVEKLVEVKKVVEVDRIIDRVIEKPVIHKVFRTKYVRNPVEYAVLGVIAFLLGLFVGLLI